MSEKKGEYKRALKALEQSLANIIDQVGQVPGENVVALAQVWGDLGKISDKLCFEANKISLAWVTPPQPPVSDMVAMGASLESVAVTLLAATAAFPLAAGALVRTRLLEVVKSMLEASKDLVRALTETLGKKYSSGTHPVLQSFGKVVEKCDTLKALPKSNKKAATMSLKDELGLLKDALGELEEARSNGFMESFEEEEGFEEQWKEDDSLILNPSLGLIKTAVAMVKKTIVTVDKHGIEEGEEVAEFDTLVPRIASLSPLVDDLALSLYPPINWSESKSNANQLKQRLELCLSLLRGLHFMSQEEAVTWTEFIGRAVTHNFSEIQRVFVTRGLAEIRVANDIAPTAEENL